MSETVPQLSLAVGDRVVYPNQGVCRVTSVDTKDIAGQKLVFVTLKREEDNAVVMVPESKVRAIGVRKLASAEDTQKLFSFLTSDSEKADLDWKQRARTNVERMSTGGIQGMVEVVKGLQVLSELRPLPTKERELYDTARHLLVRELAASLSISPCDAEDAIDIALFPPGKERPKRTAEEFRTGGDDEDVDLPESLLGLDADLGLPPEEGDSEPEPEHVEEEEAEAKPSKRRSLLSDDEPTLTQARALPVDAPVKRKRGRPPKPKPENPEPAVPKKRGRPPKARPPEETETTASGRKKPSAAPAKAASKPTAKKK